jgi:hypothetical protein
MYLCGGEVGLSRYCRGAERRVRGAACFAVPGLSGIVPAEELQPQFAGRNQARYGR